MSAIFAVVSNVMMPDLTSYFFVWDAETETSNDASKNYFFHNTSWEESFETSQSGQSQPNVPAVSKP